MPRPKKLIGDSCYLSPIREEDASMFAEWRNDTEVSIPRGEAQLIGSIDRVKHDLDTMLQEDVHIYTILSASADEPVGWVALDDLDHHNSRATLDYAIAVNARLIKGIEHETIRLILDYGFNILNLNSILAIAPSWNGHSLDVFREAGFTEIGRLRETRIIGGQYYDEVWLDLLHDEFDSDRIKSLVE